MELFEDLVRVSPGHGIAVADAANLIALSNSVEQPMRAKLPRG
ncbi:MAG: hypothetical protein WDO68_18830 [Gammaproteobacteria bacterium]